MRTTLYIFGALLVAAGVAYIGIALIGLPPTWVGIAALIIIGFGIMGAAKNTTPRSKTTTTTTTASAQPTAQPGQTGNSVSVTETH